MQADVKNLSPAPAMAQEPWKERLYNSYVSSGQAKANAGPDAVSNPFRLRGPYLRKIIRRFVPYDRQIRIVDLGCGHGACLYVLKSAGYVNVAGVDISPEQISRAHQLGVTEATLGDA